MHYIDICKGFIITPLPLFTIYDIDVNGKTMSLYIYITWQREQDYTHSF